jgi:hypothetical protein
MKERNPEATCETCPYFYGRYHSLENGILGSCVRFPPSGEQTLINMLVGVYILVQSEATACGEHPDFFAEDEKSVSEPICGNCAYWLQDDELKPANNPANYNYGRCMNLTQKEREIHGHPITHEKCSCTQYQEPREEGM